MTLSEDFQRSMLLLENDIDALGWDQPATLYAILGPPHDLYLEKMVTIDGHPADFLAEAVQQHGPFADRVRGVALATEGWKHPEGAFEEFRDSLPPDLMDRIDYASRALGVAPEEVEARKAATLARIFHDVVPPSSHHNRVEIRMINLVMRDGTYLLVARERGSAPEIVADTAFSGRIVDGLRATLGLPPVSSDDVLSPAYNPPEPEPGTAFLCDTCRMVVTVVDDDDEPDAWALALNEHMTKHAEADEQCQIVALPSADIAPDNLALRCKRCSWDADVGGLNRGVALASIMSGHLEGAHPDDPDFNPDHWEFLRDGQPVSERGPRRP